MNTLTSTARSVARRGFTLIELLVVISIIAIIAGMILAGAVAFGKKGKLGRVQAELAKLELAIDNYKVFKGAYPPDNPANPARNPLFYELTGTIFVNNQYQFGFGTISQAGVQSAFGRAGFLNASPDSSEIKSFIAPELNVEVKTNVSPQEWLLVAPVEGPNYGPAVAAGLNPWNYVSTNPTNNPQTFDLWADVVIRGTTYRVCNWQRDPIVLH